MTEMYGGNTPIVPDETSDQWELEAKLRRATERVMKSLPDIIEIDGVKYQKMESTKKPETLYDMIVDWYYDKSKGHSIDDLVEKIARNWLPKPVHDERDNYPDDCSDAWIDGWNTFRKTLIDTLGGW